MNALESTPVDAAVALVTGASRGIGRAIADHLRGRGFVVVGCSRGAPPEAVAHQHEICDVRNEEDVARLVRGIKQRHKRLDVVVNNAGVASMNHSLLTPSATVSELLDGNIRSTFVVSREGAKVMRRRGGRIVNISSVAVPLRLQGQSAYVAAKAGVESMSQVLARELGAFGITVNVIGVSPIATEMLRGVPRTTVDRLVDRLPIRRLGELDDVLNVLDFLLRPESSAVSGQVIYLGGVR